MEEFEELQSLWNQQSDATPKLNSNEIMAKSHNNIRKIKRSHFWTIGILTMLIFTLGYFYFWIFNDKIANQIKGLTLMIIVIIVRIILEIISIFKFSKIDFAGSFKNYTEQLTAFYKFRKITHFIITPLIYLSYFSGFISLLPLFKENLSEGFYLYVVISGIGFLAFFSFFLFKIVRKDLDNVNFLNGVQF
jgi:hypothetical protein